MKSACSRLKELVIIIQIPHGYSKTCILLSSLVRLLGSLAIVARVSQRWGKSLVDTKNQWRERYGWMAGAFRAQLFTLYKSFGNIQKCQLTQDGVCVVS